MSVDVITIGPHESAAAARSTMRQHHVRHLVVVDDGRVVGIVSERDIGRAAETSFGESTVQELMITDVVSAMPDTTLRQAANLMRGHKIGSLLVVENQKLVGVVTTTDVLDQLGRGATRPTVRTEPAPVRRPPGGGRVRGTKAIRGPTGPRRGRRHVRRTAVPHTRRTSSTDSLKLTRGPSDDVPPATHIRVIGADLDSQDRDLIARKIGRQLRKFVSSIERTTVRVFDANGPRGGRDQVVQIKVVLSGQPSVVVEEQDAAFQSAFNRAIKAAALGVRRSVQRRRIKQHRRAAALPPSS